MKLMSLQCPNCNGSVKSVGDNKYYCENCGTSFIADYDKEDVEYEKVKSDAELRKKQLDIQGRNNVNQSKNSQKSLVIIVVVVALLVGFVIVQVIAGIVFSFHASKIASEQRREQQQQQQDSREQARKDEEEKRKKEDEERKAQREADRQAILASYRIKAEDILKDSFFLDNATKTIEGQLQNNTNLYYTNWVFGEPEYITSYILYAKDENERTQNKVVSIYKLNWDKEYDNRTEHYVMYDGACLHNVSLNEDGTLKSDYVPHSMFYHSEIIANQFLSGYSDYDQLIRQEIYGNSDYDYVEFNMKEIE